ncbi:hypothetical protein EHS43_42505 [Streptomyces sp. RP5T]|nr:hypothetical protein EHS43_42505 [Streptomyces sp. RP5T]
MRGGSPWPAAARGSPSASPGTGGGGAGRPGRPPAPRARPVPGLSDACVARPPGAPPSSLPETEEAPRIEHTRRLDWPCRAVTVLGRAWRTGRA